MTTASRICHLPRARDQTVTFLGNSTSVATLEWAAVSQRSGYYEMRMKETHLQVLGCPGSAPAFARGWELNVVCSDPEAPLPAGLPSARFRTHGRGCSHSLQDQVAASVKYWRCELR